MSAGASGSERSEEEALNEDHRNEIKIILLGDSAVGKTKLVERFLMDKYQPQQQSTYALTLFAYEADIDGEKVPVGIWDTAGQERFKSLHPAYYHRANACILAFDIKRQKTYQHLDKWYRELQEYCKDIPCLVIANKIDLDYSVTSNRFKFAEKRGLPLYFVSASDGTNVVKTFNDAIRMGFEDKKKPKSDFRDSVLELLAQ